MDIEIIDEKLKNHIKSDEKVFNNISNTMTGYKKDINDLKDNHLSHIKDDINKLSIVQAGMKSDLKWIKLIGGIIILETLGVLTKLLFG